MGLVLTFSAHDATAPLPHPSCPRLLNFGAGHLHGCLATTKIGLVIALRNYPVNVDIRHIVSKLSMYIYTCKCSYIHL